MQGNNAETPGTSLAEVQSGLLTINLSIVKRTLA